MKSYHCLCSEQETDVLRVPSVEEGEEEGEESQSLRPQPHTHVREESKGGRPFFLFFTISHWMLTRRLGVCPHQLPKILVILASLQKCPPHSRRGGRAKG